MVDGVPSSVLYTVDLSRGSTEVLAGERSSLSPRSLQSHQPSLLHVGWGMGVILPLHILWPGRLRLLALWLGDAALDAKGSAVGARNPQ